jgi:hypothetical protein
MPEEFPGCIGLENYSVGRGETAFHQTLWHGIKVKELIKFSAFVDMPDSRKVKQSRKDDAPKANQGITDDEIIGFRLEVRANFAQSSSVIEYFPHLGDPFPQLTGSASSLGLLGGRPLETS